MPSANDVAVYETATAKFLAEQPAVAFPPLNRPDWKWIQLYGHLQARLGTLRNWRLSWWQHWALLAQYILPRRSLWLSQYGSDWPTPNSMVRGLPINQNIIDPTGTQAMRVCASGMMSGLTSPSRPWFKLRPGADVDLDRDGQMWFEEVENRLQWVMAHSNFYDSMAQHWEDLVVFGTAPILIYEDVEDVIRCYNPVAGEYFLAVSPAGRVESLFRLYNQTIAQIVEFFGLENCNQDVQEMWATKNAAMDTERLVAHAIEPNFPIADRGNRGGEFGVIKGDFTYREAYWLWGNVGDKPLSLRGFRDKPFIASRWATTSNDPYGRSIGMDVLPDIMQLQVETMRKAEGIEKEVRPPLLASVELKNEPSSILPGHVTYVSSIDNTKGMRPIYEVTPRLDNLTADLREIQERVKRGFLVDLFLMLEQADKKEMTAYEVAQKQQEKLQVLGPVIERAQNESLSPAIKRIMNIMARKQLLPPVPPSVRAVGVKVEYVSVMSLAQKAATTAGIERLVGMVGRIAGAVPQSLDLLDWDALIREYGSDLAVAHKLFLPPEKVAEIRAQKAQAQQQQAAEAQATQLATHTAPAVAGAAHDLAQTDVGGGINAIQAMLGNTSPGVGGP